MNLREEIGKLKTAGYGEFDASVWGRLFLFANSAN